MNGEHLSVGFHQGVLGPESQHVHAIRRFLARQMTNDL